MTCRRRKTTASLLAVAVALALGACASGVGAGAAAGTGGAAVEVQAPVSAVTPNQIGLEWEPEVRGGRAMITGYVYNGWVLAARDIVLLVEALDPSGQVVARTFGRVDRVVTPGSRSYFQVPVPAPVAGYRVTVSSIRWLTHDDILSRWTR